MIIENYKELAYNDLRKAALNILIAGVESVTPKYAMPKNVKFERGILNVCGDKFNITKGKLYVIGGGKASGMMAQMLEKIIPPKDITGGLVNSNTNSIKTQKIEIHKAAHPIPSKSGLEGVKKMLNLTKNLKKDDTVICLISGGGSALMPYPVNNVTLDEKKKLTNLLLKSGATTYELNVIRKHISYIKGGKLAKILQPAKVISLILSDSVNTKDDVLSAPASGPTCPDESTFKQAYTILKRYALLKKVPKSIVKHLKNGIEGHVEETIKYNEDIFKNVHNCVLANNKIALKAMKQKSMELGFNAEILDRSVLGEARAAAKKMSKFFREKNINKNAPFALVYSSETTVAVKGNGKGGRNQEYIAALIKEIKNLNNSVVASIGSDGIDFIEGVGGAIADNKTYSKAKLLKLDIQNFLNCNNTFLLHKKLSNLIKMEQTGTNVGDLNVYLHK